MEDLILRGRELNAIAYGAFSKKGFSKALDHQKYDLIRIDDFFI